MSQVDLQDPAPSGLPPYPLLKGSLPSSPPTVPGFHHAPCQAPPSPKASAWALCGFPPPPSGRGLRCSCEERFWMELDWEGGVPHPPPSCPELGVAPHSQKHPPPRYRCPRPCMHQVLESPGVASDASDSILVPRSTTSTWGCVQVLILPCLPSF